MKPWTALKARLSKTTDAQFQEPFRHWPRDRGVNQRGTLSTTKLYQNISLIFDDMRYVAEGKAKVPMSTTKPYLDVDLSKFDHAPVRGDQFHRLDTGEIYEVVNIRPDGQGWAKLDLSFKGLMNEPQ